MLVVSENIGGRDNGVGNIIIRLENFVCLKSLICLDSLIRLDSFVSLNSLVRLVSLVNLVSLIRLGSFICFDSLIDYDTGLLFGIGAAAILFGSAALLALALNGRERLYFGRTRFFRLGFVCFIVIKISLRYENRNPVEKNVI